MTQTIQIKALTVYQPWAQLIAWGSKIYETRHWPSDYRGFLAIHAGRRWTDDEQACAGKLSAYEPRLSSYKPELGAVLCVVRVREIWKTEALRGRLTDKELAFGNFAPGRFAWEMEVVEAFEKPIPVQGKPGLWDWEWDVKDRTSNSAANKANDLWAGDELAVGNLLAGHSDKTALKLLEIYREKLPIREKEAAPLQAYHAKFTEQINALRTEISALNSKLKALNTQLDHLQREDEDVMRNLSPVLGGIGIMKRGIAEIEANLAAREVNG